MQLLKGSIMTKADVIRGILQANPEGKPKELAKVASKKFGAEIKPMEISNYKTQMKKAGLLNGKSAAAPAKEPTKPASATVGRQTMTVTETVEVVKELVGQLGKEELKRLVDVV
jgi:hypothetical protein